MRIAESIFDPSEWCSRRVQATATDGRYWHVRGITGAYDACNLLAVRELMRPFGDFGEPSPVDIFLLSLGEAPRPQATKIGGIPFLRRDIDWPIDRNGSPLPFLAQFNFQHSVDIHPGLPGDVLLIFAEPSSQGDIVLLWEHGTRSTSLVASNDVPVTSSVPQLYGSRWRTTCYPGAEMVDDDLWCGIELPDGTSVLTPYFASELVGMQIGSYPFEAQPYEILRPGERFVCCIPSIVPTSNRPFPFVNHPAPLDQVAADRLSWYVGRHHDRDDFAVLYIVGKPGGFLRAQWRSI